MQTTTTADLNHEEILFQNCLQMIANISLDGGNSALVIGF